MSRTKPPESLVPLTERICLRCQTSFPSTGAANRICAPCGDQNSRLSRREHSAAALFTDLQKDVPCPEP